ncbi:hypothetical protein H1R20_g1516, partial [Candolleomyces eurysporus]
MSSNDLPEGLALCCRYAAYAQSLLQDRTRKAVGVKPEPRISLSIKGELETLVGRLLDGWLNKVRLPYSFEDILDTVKAPSKGAKDELLRQKFKGPFELRPDGGRQIVDRPTIFVD